MQTWLSGGSTTESEGTTSLMEIHMLEAQQKSICFRSFVLIYIISKHQLYDVYFLVRMKTTVVGDLKSPHCL